MYSHEWSPSLDLLEGGAYWQITEQTGICPCFYAAVNVMFNLGRGGITKLRDSDKSDHVRMATDVHISPLAIAQCLTCNNDRIYHDHQVSSKCWFQCKTSFFTISRILQLVTNRNVRYHDHTHPKMQGTSWQGSSLVQIISCQEQMGANFVPC